MSYFDVYTKKPKVKEEEEWIVFLYKKRWEHFNGKLFLDIGYGAGYFIRTAPSNAKVYGIDIDLDALRNYSRNCLLANAMNLPFRDSTFDGVHCAHLIEHLEHPEELVKEIWRVLKPEGLLMLLTPDIERYKFRFYVDPTHIRPFTKQSLYGIVKMHGFTNIRLEYGLFHDTRIDIFLRRYPSFMEYIYNFKKFLGKFYSGELICICQKAPI
jgi:ubiquinone/menaquinone biosynthesis C-methylase UbiE